ncbi:hypothetical protein BUALT_Bualt06G0112900 [Buddleja alternifolia]|uniref:Branchpoint-bridging protein n=1 Tax=Buddleja alternifolia TaxID=168488 RepID=A0AAV6XMT7_9LAMI|nr:hypothetical protein BUALT_Bualt06G0112900 [Buddleja alternifolia]
MLETEAGRVPERKKHNDTVVKSNNRMTKDVIDEEEPEEDPEEEIYEEEDPEEDIDEEPEEDPEEEIVEINDNSVVREHDVEIGASKVTANGECPSKQLEHDGISRKHRQSRWDLIQEGKTSQSEKNSKRRKTRWDNNDSQNGLFKQSGFTNVLELSTDPDITRLKMKLMKVCKKLQASEIYDKNTLIDKRNRILSELTTKLNLTPKTPAKKFVKKIFVPVKEYPTYNFIGLILGPKGNTQKKMEKESGAKIYIRGKGSWEPDEVEEDLHVLVEANDQKALDIAVAMIEKLLIPVADLNNGHKKAQLEELAKLRGTYKGHNICDLCKEGGHIRIACPLRDSTFENACCDVCGGFGHSTSNCRTKGKVDPANLYVGYLSHAIDEKRLKELFLPFGGITSTAVIKDHSTGLSKGYGFVQFEDPSDAAAAVTYMNGYKMDGKMLAVRIAGQKPVPGPTIPGHVPIPSLQVGSFSFPGHVPSPTDPIAAQKPILGHVPIPSALVGPYSFSGHVPSTVNPMGTSNFSSGYEFSSQIQSSLPDSISQFPGHREYPSSQFNSIFTNPTVKDNQTVDISQTSETDQNSNFWSTFRFS